MASRSFALRLTDIVEAIERIRSVISGRSLEEFEDSWELQWVVERGVQPPFEPRTESAPPGNSVGQGSRHRKCVAARL